MDKIEYVSFDPGMEMNSEYLTEEMAYFLGGIYASEEHVKSSNVDYMISPVRYNYSAATELEITEHYELVKGLAKRLNGYIAMAENIRRTNLDSGKNKMPGFSTFFKSTTLDKLNDLIPTLSDALKASPWSVRRSFMVGIFDGRSSADINKQNYKVRMLSLDCISDEVGSFLSSVLEDAGINYNYNTHRDRLEGGKPRNPQLRIRDVDYFISKIGLISPRRVYLLKKAYEHNYSHVEIIKEDQVLKGLKTIQMR